MQEQGLLAVWRERYWPKQQNCLPANQAQPIKMFDVQGSFYIVFGLIGFALCVLLIENIWYVMWIHRETICEYIKNIRTKLQEIGEKKERYHESSFLSPVMASDGVRVNGGVNGVNGSEI